MTDERFNEIKRLSVGFSVIVDETYDEPTQVGRAWRMNHADHQDLRVRLMAENTMSDLGADLANRP